MAARGPKGHLYEAADGFRWHVKSGNGRIVAESGEGYDEDRKAQAAFDKLFQGMYPLVDSAGEELPAREGQSGSRPGPTSGSGTGGDGLSGLPQDPKHPLFSPLTVDGNKK